MTKSAPGNAPMPAKADLAALAREIQDAQDRVSQVAPFSSRFGDFDLPAAYAVAGLVHRERIREGAVPVGRKIGFTNPDLCAIFGVREPIWAHVYDTTVVRASGAHATCSLARFAEPRIEPEIVLHFRDPPPKGGGVAEILACVDWIAHGFEIVQCHFPGWKFRAADTVADGSLHGMLLLGEPRPVERLGRGLAQALERFSLSLYCDAALRETGTGANVMGSPLLAIAHLVAVLEKQPDALPLQAGELVTTGTITAAFPVTAGQSWRTEIGGIGLPGLSVDFLD